MNAIRAPAVAGSFYPAATNELAATVTALLDAAERAVSPAPKALIVPHAGYIYSGPTAAAAYATLQPYKDCYERVVLLGPCHQIFVPGLAASGAEAFRTPLGDVPVDTAAIATLNVPVLDAAHHNEHSLEVQLPFLQAALGLFSLVPIVVGDATCEEVADVLERAWGGTETLIVISSDLSHYLPYEVARERDHRTCAAIERCAAEEIDHADACGATPVGGLLLAARRHGLSVTTIDLRNSGDTAGDKRQVVGYGAWAFAAADA